MAKTGKELQVKYKAETFVQSYSKLPNAVGLPKYSYNIKVGEAEDTVWACVVPIGPSYFVDSSKIRHGIDAC